MNHVLQNSVKLAIKTRKRKKGVGWHMLQWRSRLRDSSACSNSV